MMATNKKQFSIKLPYLRQTYLVKSIKNDLVKTVFMGRIPKALNTWNHSKDHQIWVISGDKQAFCLKANSQVGNAKQ